MKRQFTKYPSGYVRAWTMYGGGPSLSEYGDAVDKYHRHLEEDFSPFKVYEYCTDEHTPGNAKLIMLGDQEWLFRLHRSWQWGPEGDLYGPYEAGYFTPVTHCSYFPGLHRSKFIQEFPSLEAAMTYLYTTLDVEE